MSTSRHREIACALIVDTKGRFLLQQRDNILGILQPGKVGLFGGHREDGETYLQCVVREVQEEISYSVPPDCFEHLVTYDGVEMDADGGTVRGEFFIVRDVPAEALVVTEGSLLILPPDEVATLEHKLAPSTQVAIKAWSDMQAARTASR
jgi:8-oxo-dGTP diphosphatase